MKSKIIIQSSAGTLPNQIWLHPTNVKCLKGLSTPTRKSFEQASAVCSDKHVTENGYVEKLFPVFSVPSETGMIISSPF